MTPLKIAILWHQHQPYYKINGEYKLPWVRLHGIKDYFDLPALLFDYPHIKQTFNIVPSMIIQIEDYAQNKVNEIILNLTEKEAKQLNDDDKRKIFNYFFICNEKNMILPYKRYAQLYKLAKDNNNDISFFTTQDWLDLQIWYNLTWFGQISRQRADLKYLFRKGENFTEDDKKILLSAQKEILNEIIPTMKRLRDLGNIEISVSPAYHPILPLLCNSDSAKEAMPETELPQPAFKFPEDAEWHLHEAVRFYENKFGKTPKGLWPSEGSVSDEALQLISDSGIKWLATDEQILTESLHDVNRLERFFPRRFITDSAELVIFFRDRLLSDLIGFNYSNMNAEEAATDFINRLKYVRWEISSHYGEDSLQYAVVPVILDGENCWEFYKDNGKPFLDALFRGLSNEPELRTVTFSEAADEKSINYLKPIKHIRAGSWINANFDIWIGQTEHIKAWNALREARQTIEKHKNTADKTQYANALNEIHIAEGSDWFWWYHDSHQAPNKHDFDVMFRDLLKNVYKFLDLKHPSHLDEPFGKIIRDEILIQPLKSVTADTKQLIEEQWEGAGKYNVSFAMDAMHSAGTILKTVYIGNDKDKIYFRFDLIGEFDADSHIELEVAEPFSKQIELSDTHLADNTHKTLLLQMERRNADSIKFKIKTRGNYGIMTYPRTGYLEIFLK